MWQSRLIVPFAGKRVIEIPPGQRLVVRQQCHSFQEIGVEALAVPSRFFPFVIAPESAGVLNGPHSGSRAACPADRRKPLPY